MHYVEWHHWVRPTLSALSKTLIKLLYCLVMQCKGGGGVRITSCKYWTCIYTILVLYVPLATLLVNL